MITSLKRDPIQSKPWEALVGVFCPILSVCASFGTLFWVNWIFLNKSPIKFSVWFRIPAHCCGRPFPDFGHRSRRCFHFPPLLGPHWSKQGSSRSSGRYARLGRPLGHNHFPHKLAQFHHRHCHTHPSDSGKKERE